MLLYRVVDPVSGEPVRAIRDGDHFVRVELSDDRLFEKLGEPGGLPTGHPFMAGDDAILPPTVPTKIVCVGLNYATHAEEQGKTAPEEPLLFMKPRSALLRTGGTIELPPSSELVHHEGELAVVISERARKVSVDEALDYVLGYTCANDVSARDIQRRENRYTRAKGFDTFCPLGPAIITADAFDPDEHRLELRVNGEVRQTSTLDDFIFDVPELISFISHVMTLEPGDVILTGTPSGVGPLEEGDEVEVEIDKIGVLESDVERA